MPFSSFRVTFLDDDRVFHQFYAKYTFISALEYIGLDKVGRLRIKGCKSRIAIKRQAWIGTRKTVTSAKTYSIIVGISNRQKKDILIRCVKNWVLK